MKLSSRALVLTIAKFVNLGMSMLIGIVLSRLLSRSDYGDYRQVWLLFQTISPLLILGIDDSIVFFLPQIEKSAHRRILLQTAGLLGLLGLTFSSIIFFGSDMIAKAYSPNIAGYLRAFSLYPVFFLPALIAPLWLISIQRIKTASFYIFFFEAARVAGTILLVIFQFSLTRVFLWAGIVAFANVATMLWLVSRINKGQASRPDFNLIRRQLKYSLPLGLAKVLGSLLKRVSHNIVAIVLTAEAFAVFSNGAFEIPFINPMTSAVMLVLITEFVRLYKKGNYARILQIWLESLRRLATIVYPMTIFSLQFATPIMVLLFSDKYADSADVFRIFALILPLRIATYSAVLRALNRTKWILYTTVVSLAVTLLLSFLFIKWFGVVGPAFATVIGDYLMAGIFLWLIAKLLKVTIFKVYPWKDLASLAILSLIAAIPTQLFIIPRPWSSGVLLIIGIVVYGTTYLSIGFFTRVIRRDDFNFVLDFFNRLIPSRNKKLQNEKQNIDV